MLSGYFLFPVEDIFSFYKKRLSRIVIPFIVWCIVYAFYAYFLGKVDLNTALINILKIPVNFGTEVGHLWFVYMLTGIYLFAPILSPWIQTASRRSMEVYLLLWCLSLSLPYIHLIFPQVLGEAYWNHTPLLYYFSGFMGYVVLAVYIKRFFLKAKTWHFIMAFALIGTGYAITAYGFIHRLPLERYVEKLELTWGFETINVAMMTAGVFLVFNQITTSVETSPFGRFLHDAAAKSYGIYLAHILVLNIYYSLLDKHLGSAALKVPLIAIITFVSTYLLIKLLSLLPKSKWLIG
jgi:surface polysaccharide O-acyltransferase-like enzyme